MDVAVKGVLGSVGVDVCVGVGLALATKDSVVLVAVALVAFNENENVLIAGDDAVVNRVMPLFGVECMSPNALVGVSVLGGDWISGEATLALLTASTVFCGTVDVINRPLIDGDDCATVGTVEPNTDAAENLPILSFVCNVPNGLFCWPNPEFGGFDFNAIVASLAAFESLALFIASVCMAGSEFPIATALVEMVLGVAFSERKLNGLSLVVAFSMLADDSFNSIADEADAGLLKVEVNSALQLDILLNENMVFGTSFLCTVFCCGGVSSKVLPKFDAIVAGLVD